MSNLTKTVSWLNYIHLFFHTTVSPCAAQYLNTLSGWQIINELLTDSEIFMSMMLNGLHGKPSRSIPRHYFCIHFEEFSKRWVVLQQDFPYANSQQSLLKLGFPTGGNYDCHYIIYGRSVLLLFGTVRITDLWIRTLSLLGRLMSFFTDCSNRNPLETASSRNQGLQ